MVEPKAQDDLETENQDQKQETKEGTLTNKNNFVVFLKDLIQHVVIPQVLLLQGTMQEWNGHKFFWFRASLMV